jgi:hypothetical protein
MALMGGAGPNVVRPAPAQAPDAGDEGDADDVPGKIAFSCLEARGSWNALARVPCAVNVVDLDPDAAGEPPVELVFDAPAGKYRVTASHGPEYTAVAWDVEVAAGEVAWAPNEGAVVLRRVVDAHGYLAANLDPGAQSDVVGAAAAGVQVMLPSAAPAIEAAKLDDAITTCDPGDVESLDPLADRDGYLARVAAKHPVTAIARAPARTYVRADDDSSPTNWSPAREAEVVRSLRDRKDVLVSTGPFLRVAANGAPLGAVARASARHDVEVKVHVECAPASDVDHVTVSRASGPSVDLAAACASGPKDVVTVLGGVTSDDALVVSACSATSPRAVAGAIWIDADGDGESLGRRASAVPPPPKPPPPPPPPAKPSPTKPSLSRKEKKR